MIIISINKIKEEIINFITLKNEATYEQLYKLLVEELEYDENNFITALEQLEQDDYKLEQRYHLK